MAIKNYVALSTGANNRAGIGVDGATSTTPTNTIGPATPPTIQTGGDPNQFIQSDPTYQAILASLGGNEAATAAQDRASIQQDAINAGYNIPQLGQYLDPGVLGQIQSNPYSEAALAAQGHTTNLRNIQNTLAARGAYDSGELSYGVGNESQRYNEQTLTDQQNLMNQINSLLGGEANQKSTDAVQEAQALGTATQTQSALHPVGTATFDSSTGTYVDTYGNHYNANGTLVSSSAPAAPKATPPPTSTNSVTTTPALHPAVAT